MKRYMVLTPYGTIYEIDEDGCFLRYDNHRWEHPHETWKCVGIAELKPFGRLKFHSLETFIKMIEDKEKFTFKNGNPKYTLCDVDHGTMRVHGNTKFNGIKRAVSMQGG